MHPHPLVSICIPAYNCENYIIETLSCITQQTYQNLEIIVVNDGSTDNTLVRAKEITDNRIKIIDVSNGGASKARNIAYKNAGGNYIIFFDADDYILPNFIEEQVKQINNNTDIVVFADWGRFYDDDVNTLVPEYNTHNQLTFKEWIATYWYNCNPMTNPGRAIIPRGLIEKAGLWNEQLSLNDDLEFFTRICLKTNKLVFNHNALLYYRSGVGGLSGQKSNEAYQSLYKSIKLSINLVLQIAGSDFKIRQSCANLLQGFIYEVYPYQRKLTCEALKQITELAKPNLNFIAGGITSYLVPVLGWKLVKWLKLFLKLGANK